MLLGRLRSIWATSHLHLNDGLEFEVAAKLFREEVERSSLTGNQQRVFADLMKQMQETRFILSFSQHGDRLSQWRAYCPAGDGYASGLSPENPIFTSAEKKSFGLIKCEYAHEKQRELCKILIAELVDRLASNAPISERVDFPEWMGRVFKDYEWQYALKLLTASFKHNGFSEEGESRFVSQYPDRLLPEYRTGRFGVVPYYAIPLAPCGVQHRIDHITIGPTANRRAAEESLRHVLKSHKFNDTEIVMSDTPLRQ
jgi:hypothetical protein